jgi:hypothetical protein
LPIHLNSSSAAPNQSRVALTLNPVLRPPGIGNMRWMVSTGLPARASSRAAACGPSRPTVIGLRDCGSRFYQDFSAVNPTPTKDLTRFGQTRHDRRQRAGLAGCGGGHDSKKIVVDVQRYKPRRGGNPSRSRIQAHLEPKVALALRFLPLLST